MDTLEIILDLKVEVEFDEYEGLNGTLGNSYIKKSFIKEFTFDLELIEKWELST